MFSMESSYVSWLGLWMLNGDPNWTPEALMNSGQHTQSMPSMVPLFVWASG